MTDAHHDRETRIYRYILDYKAHHDGNSPSMRELMDACNISSTSLVSYYLRSLADSGRIRITGDGTARHIIVSGGRWTPPE